MEVEVVVEVEVEVEVAPIQSLFEAEMEVEVEVEMEDLYQDAFGFLIVVEYIYSIHRYHTEIAYFSSSI